MKANELRIGNLAEYFIKDNLDKRKEWWEVNVLDIDDIADIEHLGFELSGYRPIPLTEEWLVKLGAIKEISGDFIYDRFRLIWKESYKFWYVVSRYNDCYFTKIVFAHQWQNFVLVMNGKELEIQK